MLKKLIDAWKGESPLMKQIFEEFDSMLSDVEYVFNAAWRAFTGEAKIEEIKDELYRRDRAVNQGERRVRRMLVEHLTINPGHDISGCLAMMSIVKDAERLGDYAKNIFELAVLLKGEGQKLRHMDALSGIRENISRRLPVLEKAVLNSDEKLAKKVLAEYEEIKQSCNRLINGVFSEELPTKEAVGTVLVSRYLKRINSHISNVASSIIFPLDEIDFVRGDLLE